ncbi:DUF885 domain-containing protein, partial [Pseudomonas sp. GW531-E2]|uniref:DUF885 family protein n=1 Tax=Pseudomonas sp. GW531-E2 TaxID=2070679 RepID=UPI000CBB3F6A
KSLFARPVAQFPKGVPASEQPRLRERYFAAIRDSLNPALRRLRDFVRDEYRPRARASVAWTDLPLGHEWYAYRVRTATTTA